MFHAAVVGHLCLDFSPALDRHVELAAGQLLQVGPLNARPGGCVANTGLSLLQLGAPVQLAAHIGDDEVGRLLADMLQSELGELQRDGPAEAGLQLDQVAGGTTSYSIVLQVPGRDRIFLHHIGANGHFDGTAVELAGLDLLHVGYPPLLPALAAGNALQTLLRRAAGTGATTSLDMAVIDPHSDVGGNDWATWLARVLPDVGVFSPSLDDLASLYGRPLPDDPDALGDLAGSLVAQGAAVVAITAGRAGMVVRTGSVDRLEGGGRVLAALGGRWARRQLWVPALPAEVVTTNGAGDAATAGLLFGLLDGQGPEDALLSAASCARAKVTGRRRLQRYAASGMSTERAPLQTRRGWSSGHRGVLRAGSDAAGTAPTWRAG